MSDPTAPDPAEQPKSLREERRAAETVALNKEQLQALQDQARQQVDPPPAVGGRPPVAPAPTSAAPANHLVLALALAAGVVVLVLILALFAS